MTPRPSIRTAPLPEIPDTNASKTGQAQVLKLARDEGLTVRQLAQRYGGYSGLAFVGTPQSIADEMAEWLKTEGSDGFNVVFPYLPQGLDDVVDRLVPELQRRGLFRKEYSRLDLARAPRNSRPSNRFFQDELTATNASPARRQ